jgi:hypothetical protein
MARMKLPRFSLRALLGATVLAAILLGWWADHRKLASVEASSFHMFTKDSFELSTSWRVYRLECSDPSVCNVDWDQAKHLRFVARQPGKVMFTLWEKGQPKPAKFWIVVSRSP